MRHWILPSNSVPTSSNFTVIPSSALVDHEAADVPTGTEIMGFRSPQDCVIKLLHPSLTYGPGEILDGRILVYLVKPMAIQDVQLELRCIVSTQRPAVEYVDCLCH